MPADPYPVNASAPRPPAWKDRGSSASGGPCCGRPRRSLPCSGGPLRGGPAPAPPRAFASPSAPPRPPRRPPPALADRRGRPSRRASPCACPAPGLPPVSPCGARSSLHLVREFRLYRPERLVEDVAVRGAPHQPFQVALHLHPPGQRGLHGIDASLQDLLPEQVGRPDHVGGAELEHVVLVVEHAPLRDGPALLPPPDRSALGKSGVVPLHHGGEVGPEAGQGERQDGVPVHGRHHRRHPGLRGEEHRYPRFSHPKIPRRCSRGAAPAAPGGGVFAAMARRSASGVSLVTNGTSTMPRSGSSKETRSRHSSSSLKSMRRPVAAAGRRRDPRNSSSTIWSLSPW